MKQIIQNLKTGATILEEVPAPEVRRGHVLVRTRCSLVSLGTEKMLVEFGKAGLIAKARQQPERVKQVLDKIRTEGLVPTLEAVFNKLEQPLPLGYCNVGQVIAVGEGVTDIRIGDRVASNGQHAEFVCVPRNLVSKVPDTVTDEAAAFTVIASIGLQGIRLLHPTLGETVVVTGLGLIGLIAAELLKANGCRVIGLDFDPKKVAIAQSKGILALDISSGQDPVKYVESLTNGIGADAVLITASAQGNDIISQAARMCRKRGRIVLVGVIGLQLNRSEFYEKELSFQVSCSYGPGRYDEQYEQKGVDYPLPFVRWTENRNFETILFHLEQGTLEVEPLITERVDLHNYLDVYGDMKKAGSIASLLLYPSDSPYQTAVTVNTAAFSPGTGVTGIIGAGNFTKMTMLPLMKSAQLPLKYIASASGVSGTALAQKHNIACSTTNYRDILNDPEVELVMITTRHHLHAIQVAEALDAGKHVFVEKPLAIDHAGLEMIIQAYQKAGKTLSVGYNRRFSPHALKMKSLLGDAPMNVIATMNAGFIPANSWVHDLSVGGGRIVGEACHFIDLITFLTGSRVVAVCMNAMGTHPDQQTDNASILLRYENGSTGVINYFSNGSKSYAKERIEVFSQEKCLIIDNFIKLEGYGVKGFSAMKTALDKGHKTQFENLATLLRKGGAPLIPFDELVNTSLASLAALESLRSNAWCNVPAR